MPPDPDDVLAQQLRQLRREYLHDSSKRVDELRQLNARLAQDQRTALADLRQAFHRLAGSGGSYGFPDVSARSREGERLIARLESTGAGLTRADILAIGQSVDGVAGAFAAANETLSSAGAGEGT